VRLAAALSVALLVALGPGAGGLSLSRAVAAPAATVSSCSSDPGPQTAYVATDGGQLSVIALPGGHQEWSVHLPRSFSMAMSVTLARCAPVGSVLAGSRYKGPAALIRFALSDGSLRRPIPVGLPGAVSISPNGSTAYVANSGGLEGLLGPTGTTVTPVDLSTGRRLRAIGVGGQPGGSAITPNGSTVLVPLTKGSCDTRGSGSMGCVLANHWEIWRGEKRCSKSRSTSRRNPPVSRREGRRDPTDNGTTGSGQMPDGQPK
jgi:hypothetical protein